MGRTLTHTVEGPALGAPGAVLRAVLHRQPELGAAEDGELRRAHGGRGFFGPRAIDIGGNHACALAREDQRRRPADAGRGPGDQDRLAVEKFWISRHH